MGSLPFQDIGKIACAFERSAWRTLHLQIGDAELFLAKDADARPPSATAAPVTTKSGTNNQPERAPVRPAAKANPEGTAPAEIPDGWSVVTAQSLGTFYRASKPGAPVFIEIGQAVTPESELCLIEVMKLFTTIRAGISGTVRHIYGRDGDLVEVGQPLFVIEPDA